MITSLTNKKIKNLVNLIQKNKARKEQDVFITEGIRMFLEAKKENILEVYVSSSFLQKVEEEVKEKLILLNYEEVSDEVFRKISDTITPQGILCVNRQYHYLPEDILKRENPLLLLLEDIQDPGNLGTMIRTAEAAGIDGIIMSKNTVDIYNPKTIRSTMGSIFRMPFYYTQNLPETMEVLQKKGIKIYAAHLKGEFSYDKADYKEASAFLIGNEGNGLKKATADLADCYMRIPMDGQVESLNAAVASVILMYEAARQRRE